MLFWSLQKKKIFAITADKLNSKKVWQNLLSKRE